jgi:sugar (pentulose or hexulose) kinase
MILTLDVGSSSVRTLLYDVQGREIAGVGTHIPYVLHTTADGSVEIDADELARLATQCATRECGGQL